VVAFVLALVNLARRAANPAIDVLALNDNPSASLLEGAPPGAVTAPGVIVVRLAAPLFFANGDVFTQAVKSAVTSAGGADAVHHVVVDMEAVTDIDVTASESFASLREWLDTERRELAFSRVRSGARPRLEHFGVIQHETVYSTNRAAIESLTPHVGWREKLWNRLAGPARPEEHADTGPINITKSSN
jgi:SulP family sulfate permease